MKEFGENVGMAFQIRDDLLDYLGRKSIIGKPTGIDVKEKKLTLPLIHSLRHADRKDARRALRIVKNGAKQKEIEWIASLVREAGGIAYAKEKAEQYARQACSNLLAIPDSPAKVALLQFVDFVTERES